MNAKYVADVYAMMTIMSRKAYAWSAKKPFVKYAT
jgi:hypothetical protein